MKTKLKPTLILLITLIIGFVIGGLTTVTIIRHKMMNFATEEGFKEVVYDFLDSDKKQEAKLKPIIDEFSKNYNQLTNTYLLQFSNMSDSFLIEIKPILNEGQKEKAHYYFQKFEKRINDVIEQNK